MAPKPPLRKRPRIDHGGADAPVSGEESAPATQEFPSMVITLDLMYELVCNGSLAPHFASLPLRSHEAGWMARSQLSTEVEFGSVLYSVPAAPASVVAHADDVGPSKHIPLLLRAFRKVDNGAAPRTPQHAVQHVLQPGSQGLDQWAPVSVMHAVRALAAAGVHFGGLELHHAAVRSASLSLNGRPHHLARRCQTPLCVDTPALHTKVNWKLKYTVPVNYPGNQQDTVQMAWEVDADARDPDLLAGALALGLPVTGAHTVGNEVENVYVKLQWSHVSVEWTIVLHLAFVLPASDAAPVLVRDRVLGIQRPRSAADVPMWLGRMGATHADWRIEVELTQPYTPDTIARGLFLHHLIRQVNTAQTACLSRQHFVGLFHRDIRTPTDGARGVEVLACTMLRSFCSEHGIPVHAATGYPMQPRPHDLTPAQTKHLCNDVFATPKVDGLEAFLVVHRHGIVVVLRDGTTRIRCRPMDKVWVPVILEGELLSNGVFVAYDCLTTPVTNYVWRGRYITRYAALCTVVRQLVALGCPCSFKPIFHVDEYPHVAVQRCARWAEGRRIPCDGVVFISNTAPGYATGNRLWKVKYTPTIDFMVHHAYADVYEVMLRSNGTLVQSLHRFSDGVTEYTMPVLLRSPRDTTLSSGDVVEVGIHLQQTPGASAWVDFISLQLRERGKQANCLIGGMDLAARGTRRRCENKKSQRRLPVDECGYADAFGLPASSAGPALRSGAARPQRLPARCPGTGPPDARAGGGGRAWG